jgi:hypothetical protein
LTFQLETNKISAMPTTITQIEDTERSKTLLRVEGSLMLDDAVFLRKIALEMREDLGRNLTLDLADLDFLDSESAPILKKLESEDGFELEGLEFFLQKAITENEK